MSVALQARYPKTKKFGRHDVTFRMMDPSHAEALEEAILRFSNSLPSSDLAFLRMDITQPEVIREWEHAVESGRTVTILAYEGDDVVGYGNLHLSSLQWTQHIGEVRVLVGAKFRGAGLGQGLFRELIELAQAQGLDRVVAHIPSGQPRVRLMLESMDFEPEALLTDWLKDRSGHTHDLIIMSRDIDS